MLAVAGVLAIASRWLAPAITAYFGADVSTRDQLSSPYGLAVGFASLVVGVLALLLQARQSRALAHELIVGPAIPVSPGMNSLRPPDLLADESVYGRDDLMKALIELYSSRGRTRARIHILSGMPGSGKTAIALKVSHELQRRGVRVWWISAADETGLQTGMRQLAQQLAAELDVSAHELDRQWADDAPDVLWRLLNAYRGRPWMLVIDNADDVRWLSPPGELPSGGRGWIRSVVSRQGAVLVTTRDRREEAWGNRCELTEIEELPPPVGAQVLLRAAGATAGSDVDAEALSERLGGLPLALAVVGRHLAEAISVPLPGGITTFNGYRDALDQEPLANAEARGVMNSAFELSLRQMEERGHSHARQLLRLLAMFADAPVPYYLLLDPNVVGKSPLFNDSDAQDLRALLRALSGQSLLELAADGADDQTAEVISLLTLHPLLRDANLHAAALDRQTGELVRLAAVLLDRATDRADMQTSDRSRWPAWQALTPHAMHVLNVLVNEEATDTRSLAGAVRAALRTLDYLAATGLHSTALSQARTIEEIAVAEFDRNDVILLTTRAKVATLLGQGGRFDAARDRLRELLPIFADVYGEKRAETLSCRENLAYNVGKAGDPVDARDRFKELVADSRAVLGEEHPDTLARRANLANFTAEAGDFDRAIEEFRELLPVQERILGEKHPATLRTIANLATLVQERTGDQGSQSDTRQRPTWRLPDEESMPSQTPQPRDEPGWIANYRWTTIAGDLLVGLIGASIPALMSGLPTGLAYYAVVGLLPLVWIAAIGLTRGYESRYFGSGPEEFRSVLLAGIELIAVVAVTAYLARIEIARGVIVLSVPAMILLSFLVRYCVHFDLARRRYMGLRMRRVLIVGGIGQATMLRRQLEASSADGFQVVVTCVPQPGGRLKLAPREPGAMGAVESDILAAIDHYMVDVAVLASDAGIEGMGLRKLSWALEQRNVELIVSPSIVEVVGPRISIRPIAGLSLLHVERPYPSGGPLLLKSIFDKVGAATLLIPLLPFLLLVAVMIRMTSSGSAIYRDTRVGAGGKQFSMLKFRTMYIDAERRLGGEQVPDKNSVLFKIREDPRVTPVGKVLRRFSVDELPQLLNVLRGDMSLVGPRPPQPDEVAIYGADFTHRMLVRPGLTGLWQVSGRSDLSWEESVNLDLRYVDNWSLALDLLILWRTARAVLGNDSAY